jgi:uncharacterized membrane protein YeaQ/YmgE (transglycosylase-associated protein family)
MRSALGGLPNLGQHMNLLVWLVLGGALGGLAGLLLGVKDALGLVLYASVGMLGALLGGWFVSPLLGIGTLPGSQFNTPALLVSFIGSAILLATTHSFDHEHLD